MDTQDTSKTTNFSTALDGVVGVTFLVRSDSSGASDSDHSCSSKITICELLDELDNEQLEISNDKGLNKKVIASWKRSEIKTLEALVLEHGTDFSSIGRLMGKPRDQIKRKYKVMQKKFPNFGFEPTV